jgi:XTP/dITP diphosphohydrolase
VLRGEAVRGREAGRTVLVATRSPGKLAELRPLLAEFGLEAESLDEAGLPEEAVEETIEAFETFEENALAKARHFHARSGGRVVLAEDSGLCVDALGGAPGVRSKRWGGTDGLSGRALDAANNQRLLHALARADDRRAHYACCAALVWDGGHAQASGTTAGRILAAPCGALGFGYDPYFWSDELGACFGQVDKVTKGRVSHRARAVRSVLARFVKDFSGTS